MLLLIFYCFVYTIYFQDIYYSQKELKHFALEILVIHGILEHVLLNIFKYIFCYICTKIRKEKYLNYSQIFLNYTKCHKDFNTRKLLSKNRKSSTIYWDATLLALILHLSFFKFFAFFKFNMLDKKSYPD